MYRKLMLTHPGDNTNLILALSFKAMNNTRGPDSIDTRCWRASTSFTRSETPTNRQTIDERAKISFEARQEMKKYLAKIRTDRALRHAIPAAAYVTYEQGEEILVWREQQVNNRIGESVGPHVVDAWDPQKKLVYIRETQIGPIRPFNVTQVKKYLRPHDASHTHIPDVSKDLFQLSHTSGTFEMEVLHSDHPCAMSEQMKKAITDKVKGLLARAVFRIFNKRKVPLQANTFP